MSDKAILILCAAVALVVLAASVALCVVNRRNPRRIIRILGAGVFLMLVALTYPDNTSQDTSFVLGLALVQSMAAMLLNANATELLAAFDAFEVSFIGAYKAILLILLIVAPLFTVGITLSFFSDKFSRLLYRMRSAFRPSYLFSEINERTLCIAEEVAGKDRRAVIVFAVRTDKEDIDAEWLDRIKKIGTVINEDIVNISHSLKRERNYYLLCADGSANLDAGLRLYQKYNGDKTGNVNMWLYTHDEVTEVIFDHLYETFNVRLINEEGLISRSLVTKYPLYDAVQGGRLSVLIVGGGKIGLEILRLSTACSCLGDGVEVEINVIDVDGEKARTTFEKTAPLLSKKWGINFHTADVNTSVFTEKLKAIKPTYVVISLGNESRNMETALYVRRVYGNENGLPHIHAVVDHKRIDEQITPNLFVTFWTYSKEQVRHTSEPICSFDIKTFGSYEDIYSNLRIGASYLDCLAVAHNATYCGIREVNGKYTPALLTDLYNQVMFFKNYSDGFAVSVQYKLYLMGLELVDDGKGDIELLNTRLPQNIKLMRSHENRRHEAFMRGDGWADLPANEVKNKMISDKLKKLNARLDNSQVKELEEKTGRDFDREDEQALYNLPTIILLANRLYGKNYSVRQINTDKGV